MQSTMKLQNDIQSYMCFILVICNSSEWIARLSATLSSRAVIDGSLHNSTSCRSKSPLRSRPFAKRPTCITPLRVLVLCFVFCSLATSFVFILLGNIHVLRLSMIATAFLLLSHPVGHDFESPLPVGHHALDCLCVLLCWINGRMFCHYMAIIVHKNSHWTHFLRQLNDRCCSQFYRTRGHSDNSSADSSGYSSYYQADNYNSPSPPNTPERNSCLGVSRSPPTAQATSPTKASTVLQPEPSQRPQSLRPIRQVAIKEEAATPPIQPPTAPGGADQTTATARRATPTTVTVEARAEEQLWLRQAAYNLGSQGLRGAHQGKQGG